MRILFIGGTGVISTACAHLAASRGLDVTLLNRGESFRPTPDGASVVHANIRDPQTVRGALGSRDFDVVVDFIAYTPEHVAADVEFFRDRTGQYVFVSSASVYRKPVPLPVTERAPVGNAHWQYARDKIACERVLADADIPWTIVRPAHTYDPTRLPIRGGYTQIDRMRRGRPVVIPGDGTSIWVVTHHEDFAVGFVGLLGRPEAIGESFHITSDELLTWNEIYVAVARAAGAELRPLYLPSTVIAAIDPEWGGSLLGDKAHSVFFDNSKVRSLVPEFAPRIPFVEGAAEGLAWYDADPGRRTIDDNFERTLSELEAIATIPARR